MTLSIGRIDASGPDSALALTPHRDASALWVLTATGAPQFVVDSGGRIRAGFIVAKRSPNPRMWINWMTNPQPNDHCRDIQPQEFLYLPGFDGLGPNTTPNPVFYDFDDFSIMKSGIAEADLLRGYATVSCDGGL